MKFNADHDRNYRNIAKSVFTADSDRFVEISMASTIHMGVLTTNRLYDYTLVWVDHNDYLFHKSVP